MAYAFTFDASACTGCKACQIACKDKNDLPAGVLWRRVYEVSGGSWVGQGEAWVTDVFAYYLSMACNHCVHPKCAGVCPTDAFVQRKDGIVYIDESKCMGCGYCNWACPYGVPQYNPEPGHMTKCNFCVDYIDAGLPPACVAACPMRVLDFTVISDRCSVFSENYQQLWDLPASNHPFPLPEFSRTQPHLAIKPHPAMGNGLEKVISNCEEVKLQRHKDINLNQRFPSWLRGFVMNLDELPLVAFTLLGQMAAGMTVFSFFVPLSFIHLLAIGLLLALGGLASFLHLGTKKNAWRAVIHLKKSWLSREVLAFGLFGAAWLAWMLERCSLNTENWTLNTDYWSLPTALLGLALVFSMARVYHLHAVSDWNTWRTEASFFLAAGTLGGLATALLTGETLPAGVGGFFLAAEALLALSGKDRISKPLCRLRLGLIAGCLAGVGGMFLLPGSGWDWIAFPTFLLGLLEEGIGRWEFYALRSR